MRMSTLSTDDPQYEERKVIIESGNSEQKRNYFALSIQFYLLLSKLLVGNRRITSIY